MSSVDASLQEALRAAETAAFFKARVQKALEKLQRTLLSINAPEEVASMAVGEVSRTSATTPTPAAVFEDVVGYVWAIHTIFFFRSNVEVSLNPY